MTTIVIPMENELKGIYRDQLRSIYDVMETTLQNINQFSNELDRQLADFNVPMSDLGFTVPSLDVDPFTGVQPRAPDVNTQFDATFPGEVALTDVTAPMVPMPSHDIDPPALPDRPDLSVSDIPFNVQAPAVNMDVQIPAKPTLQPLTAPTQAAVTIQEFAGLELPQWDGTFPVDDIGDLSVSYGYTEPAYQSEIYEKIRAWVTDVIENGGTGLGEEVLAAIRANFRSWLDEEMEEEYERILKFESSRGFTIPTGSMNARLRTFWNKRNRKIQENDNQLMAEEARLAQQNTQFAVQQGTAIEQLLREAHNQLANRSLQLARESVAAAIEIYNGKIARYTAALEAAKAKASVFESRTRAAGLVIDQYKAEIDAQKLTLEANSQEVQVYLALQQANGQLIDMWAKETDASRVILENERNKILIFKEQIEAFSAQVNAQKVKVDAHNALLAGDQAKTQIYSEKMKGYGILTDAVKSQNQLSIEQAKLRHDVLNRGKIDVHNAALQRADALIKAQTAMEGFKLEKYKSEAQGFESLSRAYQAFTGAKTQAYDSQLRYAAAMVDKVIKEAEINQQSLLMTFSAKLETLKARVQTWSQTVASCLGTLSNNLSLGMSGSYSGSISTRVGVDVSESHNHTYCEKSCD